ncbi:MAG: stress protein [Cyclobacteriaceae bacterium]
MIKRLSVLLIVSFWLQTGLIAQNSYSINSISTSKTSNNTVTCTIYQIGDKYYAYSGGDGNKVDAFEISNTGVLQPIESYTVTGGKKAVRGLVADQVHGKNFLFAGLKGGNMVEVFEINDDGTLKSVSSIQDTEQTYLGIVITLQVVHMSQDSYLFVGGLEKNPGLSCFRILPDGSLEHVQSMADTEAVFTDGIIGMSLHQVQGKTVLMTGGFQDNGLSNFQVFEDGHFEHISSISDDHIRYLNGTYPVISVRLNNRNFVVVGHRHHIYYKPTPWIKDRETYYYHGDAVSVFMLDNQAELIPRSLFKGDASTLIKGQTRLHSLPIDDKNALVAIATRDDQSIQLCVLKETGLLVDAGKIKTGFPIYYGLAGHIINGEMYLLAGSVGGNELVTYKLDKNAN